MVRPGFVVDGYQKYVGMGLVHRSMKEMLSGKKDGFQVGWNAYYLLFFACH